MKNGKFKNKRRNHHQQKNNKTVVEKANWQTKMKETLLAIKRQFSRSNAIRKILEHSKKKPAVIIFPVALAFVMSYFFISSESVNENQMISEIETLTINHNKTALSTPPSPEQTEIDGIKLDDIDPPLANETLVSTTLEDEEETLSASLAPPSITSNEEHATTIVKPELLKNVAINTLMQPTHLNAVKEKTGSNSNLEKSWVFNKKPDQYTVQLISGTNKSDIEKFIENNKNLKRLSYFQTVKNGKPWYVAVQSTYDNYSDAYKARKALPKHIAQNKPWIRKYGTIQKELSTIAENTNLLNSSFASAE